MGTQVKVTKLPLCDFCRGKGINRPAQFDFKTTNGQWANGCKKHYETYRLYDKLGTGMGQELIQDPIPAPQRS